MIAYCIVCDTELCLDQAQQIIPDVWLMGYQELASTYSNPFFLLPYSY